MTIQGPSAPPDRLRQFYSRATILTLAEIGPNEYRRNVNTTLVFGTKRMRRRPYQTSTKPSRDASRSGRYWASIVVVNAAEADAFVTQAKQGSALLPGQQDEISFDLDEQYDGFIPRDPFADASYDKMPGHQASWRRRFPARERSVNGVPLNEGHLADLVAELPKFTTIEYETLNLEHALDRIGALDVIYPSFVRATFRPDDNGVRYTIHDPHDWLPRLGQQSLSMEFRQLGMLVEARALAPIETELIETASPLGVRHWLSADGVLLDGSDSTFIRSVGINMGNMRPPIKVSIGARTAEIPTAPTHVSHVKAGNTQPLPNVFEPRHLAWLWRQHTAQHAQHAERVFDGTNNATCRVSGLELLSKMIQAAVAGRDEPTIVRVVDPFGIDVEALKAMIPLAAGIASGELWLLSENRSEPPTSLHNFIQREIRKWNARLRKIQAQDVLDERFSRSASKIAAQLGVKIRWYKPTVAMHDRFLVIHERIWHVGHSYNRFGCDLSAIVELRDLEEKARLRRVFDEQFAPNNLKGTFG